ncbi:MAG: chemotaxis protein CheA [Steroidobacteraceae bacterium]|nr:chemotaxis protein CheA [Steroidobacteraceae bacterium]
MEAALLRLEAGATGAETINTVFRVAHSLKGGAGMFGFHDIVSFTHTLEAVLDALRGRRLQTSAALTGLLLGSVDLLRGMLEATRAGQPVDLQRMADLQFDLELLVAQPAAPAPAARIRLRPGLDLHRRGNDPLQVLGELAKLGRVTVRADIASLPPLADLDPGTCHLAWEITADTAAPREAIAHVFEWMDHDGHVEIDAGPAAAASSAPAVPAAPVAVPGAGPATAAAGAPDAGSIRVGVEKLDDLMNSVGELVITQTMLAQVAGATGGLDERLHRGLLQLERNVRELQESVMRVRMLPISAVFSRFPRLVRDLAQRFGKRIELQLGGEHTELDKTVLEKIGDPLVHLVRNSIDHGIEPPDVRTARGKNPVGTIHLDASQRGGCIVVEVRDDGAGLDRRRIIERARKLGLLVADEEPDELAVNELIFAPGFSTADQATDVSGRGVGMDVVRRNVKALGGSIEVESRVGEGARFTLTLPFTLAIVDGQTVAVGGERYVVPVTSIVESLRLAPGAATRVAGSGGDVFTFRGDYLPVVRLHELFGVQPAADELHSGLIMVVEGDGRRAGLFVDDVEGQLQAVIKSIEANYEAVDGVSGATITADGNVALILDVPALVRTAGQRRPGVRA